MNRVPRTEHRAPMPNFPKSERLSGVKLFEHLAKKGNSFFSHPYKIIWMMSGEEQAATVRIAFGVPKRNFKQAVKRNRIKRLLREAYRLHKRELVSALELKSVKIVVMCIYTGKDVPSYSETEGKIILSLHRLLNAIDGAGKHPEA